MFTEISRPGRKVSTSPTLKTKLSKQITHFFRYFLSSAIFQFPPEPPSLFIYLEVLKRKQNINFLTATVFFLGDQKVPKNLTKDFSVNFGFVFTGFLFYSYGRYAEKNSTHCNPTIIVMFISHVNLKINKCDFFFRPQVRSL